jgi:MHS family alpha-ketoglutarate permease-like MFS transporter
MSVAQDTHAAAAPNAAETNVHPLSRLKSIFGGSVGNLIEWYDWLAYSAFSLYFAKAFFPSDNQTLQLLNTAAIFAVGYLMRPVGALVMGAYADRRGRRAALTLSVLLMCGGSLLIAVAPGYQTLGVAAPLLLLTARMLQGLSVGGEYGTSATYLSEMATPAHRGFYSSFQYVTLQGGQLLSLIVLILLQQVFLSAQQLDDWGWRIPFFIGAGFAVVAFYLRRRLAETEAFETRQKTAGNLLKLLLRHPRAIATVAGLTLGGTVAVNTFTVYMQKFLVNSGGLSKSASSLVTAGTLVFFMCLQPLVGALSDRIGRRPILITFGVLGTLMSVPLLTAISRTRSPWTATALILVGLVIVSGYTAVNAVTKAELFPTEVRALGVGLPYAIVVSIFGGTTEYFGLLFKQGGREHWFYWYVAGCILISLLVYVFVLPETRTKDLEEI